MASHLNDSGIAVVGVDLRGHGRTRSKRGVARCYEQIAGDVETLVHETSRNYPDVPHFLFGHSMGGGLVLHHGLTTQSNSLAGYLVSAPLIFPKRQVPGLLRAFVKVMRKIVPAWTLPIPVSGKNISTIPEEQDRYDNDPLNHDRLSFGLAVGMTEAGKYIHAHADQWNRLLRMWHSRDDKITDFDATAEFAEKASNCDFTALDEVQHEMHQDRSRDEVYRIMMEFILSSLR